MADPAALIIFFEFLFNIKNISLFILREMFLLFNLFFWFCEI